MTDVRALARSINLEGFNSLLASRLDCQKELKNTKRFSFRNALYGGLRMRESIFSCTTTFQRSAPISRTLVKTIPTRPPDFRRSQPVGINHAFTLMGTVVWNCSEHISSGKINAVVYMADEPGAPVIQMLLGIPDSLCNQSMAMYDLFDEIDYE